MADWPDWASAVVVITVGVILPATALFAALKRRRNHERAFLAAPHDLVEIRESRSDNFALGALFLGFLVISVNGGFESDWSPGAIAFSLLFFALIIICVRRAVGREVVLSFDATRLSYVPRRVRLAWDQIADVRVVARTWRTTTYYLQVTPITPALVTEQWTGSTQRWMNRPDENGVFLVSFDQLDRNWRDTARLIELKSSHTVALPESRRRLPFGRSRRAAQSRSVE